MTKHRGIHTNKSNGHHRAHVGEAANQLLNESRKLANELYAEGINLVNHQVKKAEGNVKEYSDTLIKKIQHNPISSVFIAAGIGFILSKVLKK